MGYSSQKIKPRQTFYTISVQKIMYFQKWTSFKTYLNGTIVYALAEL